MRRVNTLEARSSRSTCTPQFQGDYVTQSVRGQQKKGPFSHDTWQASWETKKKSNLVENFDLEGALQIH